jgi:hypothetical protein
VLKFVFMCVREKKRALLLIICGVSVLSFKVGYLLLTCVPLSRVDVMCVCVNL